MVGYDSRTKHLTHSEVVFAGATSGFITRATCQPLDVLKIRFQLQVEPVSDDSPVSKYRSIRQAIGLILKEEGVTALWKGHVPAQLLSVTYGAAQFWAFETFSKEAHRLGLYEKYRPVVHFGCGALSGMYLIYPLRISLTFVAGCVGTIVSFPFDVIRTRLVGQSIHFRLYTGILNALTQIWRHEGFPALFRGLWPTLLQVAPHAGVQFMSYKLFDGLYKSVMGNEDAWLGSSIFAGGLAGLCAKTSIYPFDLMKKRMQIQGIQKYRAEYGRAFLCRGMVDCFRRTFECEGLSGVFKGLSPSLLKAVCTSAMHFTTYEVTCKILEDVRSLKDWECRKGSFIMLAIHLHVYCQREGFLKSHIVCKAVINFVTKGC